MNTPSRKPWFGPKRIGWGIGPQTWQGYVVVALIVLAVFLIVHFW